MATIQDVLDGLKVLRKYGDGEVCAEHDILAAPPSIDKDTLSEDDREAMLDAGWHWSEEFDCWARFT